MRIIRNVQEGRERLLSRRPLDPDDLPLDVRETIYRTFGQELGPDEVVRRVIRDVREDGDNGIRYYNTRFDNAPGDGPLVVTEEEIRAAYWRNL